MRRFLFVRHAESRTFERAGPQGAALLRPALGSIAEAVALDEDARELAGDGADDQKDD